MHLEFEQGLIAPNVYNELGFTEYLQLFELKMPIISHKILRPLNHVDGEHHFAQLEKIKSDIKNEVLDIKKIEKILSQLPSLDSILPFFKQGNLQHFHLHTLGRFLLLISQMDTVEINESIEKICRKYLEQDFSTIILTTEETNIKNKIKEQNKIIEVELKKYEKKILKDCGIKMIYPYPKEIELNQENIDRIKSTQLLTITTKGNFHQLDYILDSEIEKIVNSKKKAENEFSKSIDKKLKKINLELEPFYNDFYKYYNQLVERAYFYSLIIVATKNNLVIPKFTQFEKSQGVEIKYGTLPLLKKENIKRYVPLDIKLSKGSNILFGSNMSGKTTALKTVFFHLSLIRVGLPVPAKSVTLHFPENVEFHLKTSGDIKSHLSSFTDEINFFARVIKKSTYLLIDELFQSTNPISGATLARIFLESYQDRENILFCTSHFLEILKVENINLLQMKEPTITQSEINSLNLDKLISKIPYTIEHIDKKNIDQSIKDSKRPLQLALHFPLDQTIKVKIKNAIKD